MKRSSNLNNLLEMKENLEFKVKLLQKQIRGIDKSIEKISQIENEPKNDSEE